MQYLFLCGKYQISSQTYENQGDEPQDVWQGLALFMVFLHVSLVF